MLDLLKKLIESPSTAMDGELGVAELIAEGFSGCPVDCEIDCWDGNRANITAILRSSGEKPAIVFSCHLDVVPAGEGKWEYEPFCAHQSEGRMYGRGAADMKSGTAAAVEAIRQISASGKKLKADIIFSGTAGEETDSCGAKRFVEQYAGKINCGGVVICEPTALEVVTRHRGLLWLEIATKGKTAHGSMPEAGINAISSMTAVMAELDKYRTNNLPDGCTLSINRIAGGKATNVVPDSCVLGVDIRTPAGVEHEKIIADVESILKRLHESDERFAGSVSVERNVEGLGTDESGEFVRGVCESVGTSETVSLGFCTDGPFFEALGGPVLLLGPGKPELCHKPDEYVDIAEVEKAVEYYKRIIERFCL